MKITNNAVVNAEYELFVDGDNGELELMEKTTRENPLSFIFGVGMMLPKFEENLKDLKAGDSFEFSISSEEAYGKYNDEAVIELERKVFEVDGKMDEEMVFEGNMVPLMDSEGNRFQALVLSVTDTHVTVDLNHPLAGENLHFKGKVLDVREATEDELNTINSGCDGCGGGGGCNNGECGEHKHGHDHDECGCGGNCD
ncbi:MAG: peptidylprolyl isomerase [Bacteroidales bacterium]|nr:peptidylprolyl isomerase [Bacteroidales bacterium]